MRPVADVIRWANREAQAVRGAVLAIYNLFTFPFFSICSSTTSNGIFSTLRLPVFRQEGDFLAGIELSS